MSCHELREQMFAYTNITPAASQEFLLEHISGPFFNNYEFLGFLTFFYYTIIISRYYKFVNFFLQGF